MAEQRIWASGAAEDAGRTALLPDLTDIDLRTLRAMDDPGLTAAVEGILGRARELGDYWHSGGEGESQGGHHS